MEAKLTPERSARNKSPNRGSFGGYDSLMRQSVTDRISKTNQDGNDEDLQNYTELLLKKEQEIKEISILKLK